MDFGNLAKFPMQDEDDWIMTVLIGGVLLLVGGLLSIVLIGFVPLAIVFGYVVEVMRGGVRGDPEPPEFGEWGDLAVDGLKAYVIGLVYQIPAAVVGIAVFLLSTVLLATGTDAGAGLGLLGFFLTFGVWTILSLVFGYVGMAGIVNFAVEDSIGAAFDLGTLKTVALSSEWVMAWAFYIAISLVANILGSLAGGLGTPFTGFYALSSGGRAFGEAFAAATGKGATATPTAEATTETA